ncbi:MAG: hypothetical protein LBG48_02430 [Rickettsiales bacterium]|jgi:hypothetical protein|nr:hypothetical protein [Rickettsiales bacterium]
MLLFLEHALSPKLSVKATSALKFTPLVELVQLAEFVQLTKLVQPGSNIGKTDGEGSVEEVTAAFDDGIELDGGDELDFEEPDSTGQEKEWDELIAEQQNLENEHKALEHESKALDEGLKEVSATLGNNHTLGSDLPL